METRKLSEVLAELQQKQGEANDKIIMSRDGKTYSMGATQMYPASEANSGVMTVEHVAQLVGLTNRLSGVVSDAPVISLSDLDNFDKTILRKQGWYIINNQLTPQGHMLITADPMSHVCYQVVIGNYEVENDKITSKHTDGRLSILFRCYGVRAGSGVVPVGTWTKWKYYQQGFLKTDNSILDDGEAWTYGHTKIDDIVSRLPTAQATTQGTDKTFVYSSSTDKTKSVLSGVFKVYQNGGKIRVTHKLWGSTSDYNDAMYYSADFPTANASADGAMSKDYASRLNNATLFESNSTTDNVCIKYPNYASGGNKTLTLTAATSAKAGVMTVEHVKMLGNVNSRVVDLESTEASKRLHKIESHYKDLGHFENEIDALNKITELSVCADENLLHAHLTYTLDDGSHSSLILVQEIEGKWTRQIIINHTKIFQRTLYFKTTERTELDWKENWSYLFCDRLTWNNSERKYIPSQFGESFNSEYTDQIPLASDSVDGLMSKEDKALLEKIKKQLNL